MTSTLKDTLSGFILELETLKKIVESESQNTSKVVKIQGLWKGIDITDQDLIEAKNSVITPINKNGKYL